MSSLSQLLVLLALVPLGSEPIDFYRVNEMHGQCLAFSNDGRIQIIGQEFISNNSNNQTYNLLHLNLQ